MHWVFLCKKKKQFDKKKTILYRLDKNNFIDTIYIFIVNILVSNIYGWISILFR
jgi:hypothetical protein